MKHIGEISPLPSCGTIARPHGNDPLRRFTPTPHAALLPVMGRRVRVETNNRLILERMQQLFARYPGAASRRPDFLWRIVSQSEIEMAPPWPRRTAFSGNGLRYAEFGQRNFIAVDIAARKAIAFLAEGLVKDEVGFTMPFADSLFLMTASSLGLVSLRANCVAHNGKALLVFGAQNSGKTTASYLATKLGLQFVADDGVFAEIANGGVRVWGGFWPLVFRRDAVQHLPELPASTRALRYRDSTFHHLTNNIIQTAQEQPITPVCCVFLKRLVNGDVKVKPIDRGQRTRLLVKATLLKEDSRFADQQATVIRSIANLPAYLLTYESNPAAAASSFKKMILTNRLSSC